MLTLWRRLRAFLGGYFWLPCPSCGNYFASCEWVRDPEDLDASSIPNGPPKFVAASDGSDLSIVTTTGIGICPACTADGVGTRAWDEFRQVHGWSA